MHRHQLGVHNELPRDPAMRRATATASGNCTSLQQRIYNSVGSGGSGSAVSADTAGNNPRCGKYPGIAPVGLSRRALGFSATRQSGPRSGAMIGTCVAALGVLLSGVRVAAQRAFSFLRHAFFPLLPKRELWPVLSQGLLISGRKTPCVYILNSFHCTCLGWSWSAAAALREAAALPHLVAALDSTPAVLPAPKPARN